MENRSPESGMELVLDNRKLIVAFAILIAVCGCFFVLGFVEGRRQATQEVARNQLRDSMAASAEQPKKQTDERAPQEQLDWYKSVSDRDATAAKTASKPAAIPQSEPTPARATAAEPAVAVQPPAAPAAKTVYSVQVGVFKNRDKVEAEQKSLKAKGYEGYIDQLDSGVFSLRVGKFDSRAEAVAMSHRLKSDGFAALIKAK